MNIQDREERNNFIESLPNGVWLYLVQLCSTTLDFYSSKKPEYNTDSDVGFFLDLLKGKEKSIDEFRNKFKVYIENNGGKFKELTPFPEYFHPRDKKINNFEADKIRTTLYFEKDKTKRSELIEELNKIKEEDNPDYQSLTKIEEAEHCLFWAIESCRYEFKNDHLNDVLGLPKATFLYGVACGLLGLDVFGTYYKLNEEKTAQQQGGDVLQRRAKLAQQQVVTMWNDRFNNPNLIKKGKAEFGRYIYNNPHLITDENGNTLKKPNGEQYYNDPKYIEGLVPKNT
jgi:hypothetical protein